MLDPVNASRKILVAAVLAFALANPSAYAAEPDGVVNVNTASQAQLMLLWRTGETTAKAIIEGRPYETAEQLDGVKGIGPRWATVNGPFVVLEGATTLTVKIVVPSRKDGQK